MKMAIQQPTPVLSTANVAPAPAVVGYTLPTQPETTIPCLAPPLLSGLMLYACFFPLGLYALAWVSLIPFLCMVRTQVRTRAIFLYSWLGGVVFFGPALYWMTAGDKGMGLAWVGLTMYCALYFPAAVFLTRLLERRTPLPLVVTFPAVWVALEFARSFLLTGFAWYYLGHSQHAVLPLIQVADLGGVYLVSLLIAAANAWCFDFLYQFEAIRRLFQLAEPMGTRAARIIEGREIFGEIFRRRVFLEALVLAVLIGATIGYGHLRMAEENFLPGPRIALLQGNLDQKIRDASTSPDAIEDILARIRSHYSDLCVTAAAQSPRPDLIIWPESSFPHRWWESSPQAPREKIPEENRRYEINTREALRDMVSNSHRIGMLLGMNATIIDEEGRQSRRSSAVLLNAHGSQQGRYDKIHRVPFGEYIPFRDWLPLMNVFSPYDYDYNISAGETMPRLPLKQYHFGVLICYEDTDPFLARRYARETSEGKPVDFLVNMSNDGWFDGSVEHEEHLAISRFRAIETRRALVRSVNMGISAVIDGNGRVQKPRVVPGGGEIKRWVVEEVQGTIPDLDEKDWAAMKKVGGVLTATVPLDNRGSWYVIFGDWLPGLCWLLIGGVLMLTLVKRLPARRGA